MNIFDGTLIKVSVCKNTQQNGGQVDQKETAINFVIRRCNQVGITPAEMSRILNLSRAGGWQVARKKKMTIDHFFSLLEHLNLKICFISKK